jgi:hypothetical protein
VAEESKKDADEDTGGSRKLEASKDVSSEDSKREPDDDDDDEDDG